MTLELLGIGSPYLVSPGPHKHKLWSLNLHSCRENDPSLSNLSSKLQLSNPGSILTNPLHHVQCSHTFPIMQWPDLDAFTTQVVAQVLFTQKETVWPIESLLVLGAIQSVPILAPFYQLSHIPNQLPSLILPSPTYTWDNLQQPN